MQKDQKTIEERIAEWKTKAADLQRLKFGQLIDIDSLDKMASSAVRHFVTFAAVTFAVVDQAPRIRMSTCVCRHCHFALLYLSWWQRTKRIEEELQAQESAQRTEVGRAKQEATATQQKVSVSFCVRTRVPLAGCMYVRGVAWQTPEFARNGLVCCSCSP